MPPKIRIEVTQLLGDHLCDGSSMAATSSIAKTEVATVQGNITPEEMNSALRHGQVMEAWVLSLGSGRGITEVLIGDLRPKCSALREEVNDIFFFVEKLPSLPPPHAVEVTIDTGTDAPVYQKPYRICPSRGRKGRVQATTNRTIGYWTDPTINQPMGGTDPFCTNEKRKMAHVR